jgi:hypothetical protein
MEGRKGFSEPKRTGFIRKQQLIKISNVKHCEKVVVYGFYPFSARLSDAIDHATVFNLYTLKLSYSIALVLIGWWEGTT